MSESADLGRAGEERAARLLEGLGWKVLDRGWRSPFGELDLVALDGATLVFVEVKARSSKGFGGPEAAVGARKRSRTVRAAQAYLRARGWETRACRFDVVALAGDETRHYRDAFQAEGWTP